MRPVSSRYLQAVRGSHDAPVRVRLVTPGQTGVTPDGVELAVIGGSVKLDASADVRTTADLELAEAWTTDGTGIAPYGQEIYVERGISYGNGQREWVGFGYLRLEDVDQEEAPTGPLQVNAFDRMRGIVEARMLAPVQYLAGQTVGFVVEDLVTAVYPAAVIEWDDATDAGTLSRSQIVEEDRHAFLRELVTSYGKIMYWDHRGVLVIKDPPDPAAPVFEVDAGRNGVLVRVSRSLSRQGVYNAVVASGEAVDDAAPVFAVAYDDDPASLTYWDGAFGKVPRFFSSPFIATEAQALTAAQNMLSQSLGLPYEVNLAMVPNAALEPLDAVRVVYPVDMTRHPHTRREDHVLETIDISLEPGGAMTATTRRKSVTI